MQRENDLMEFVELISADEAQFPEKQNYLMPALQAAVDTVGGATGVCSDDYIDTLLTGIEENEDDFPYTIACSNFIDELKKKNIIADFYKTFDCDIIDKIYRETSDYLAR